MLILSFTISSCGTGEKGKIPTAIDYTIKNISSYDINLTVFNVVLPLSTISVDTIFEIQKDKIIYFPYINSGRLPFDGAADSAYITFDDNFRIIYRRGDLQPRNILDINSYSGGEVKENWLKYEYTITNEDYNNAEPIE